MTLFPIGALFLDELTATLGDIGFVLILIAFCYLAFMASIAFGSNALLFTLVLAGLAYAAFAFPLIVIAIAAVAYIAGPSGMNLQFALQQGLMPMLGRDITGTEFANEQRMEFEHAEAIERYKQGVATQKDIQLLQSMQQQQQGPQRAQRLPPGGG